LYFHQVLSPYNGCSYCYGLMDYVCLFYYLPWVYFSLKFIKVRVDQQQHINSTITAADFKGSLTVVHNGSPAEIVNKNSRAVVQQEQSSHSKKQPTLNSGVVEAGLWSRSRKDFQPKSRSRRKF